MRLSWLFFWGWFAGVGVLCAQTTKLPQSITFAAPPEQFINRGPVGVTATASSGLPVTFEVLSGPANLGPSATSPALLHLVGVGTVVVRATQIGDASYEAASAIERSFLVVGPENDSFAGALIMGTNATVFGSTVWASLEAGEPVHVAGNDSGASLWWKWTPTYAADVVLSTAGSDFDTVLAVYAGANLNELVPLATNDDAAAGTSTSRVSFRARVGETYRFAVAGKNAAKGAVQLAMGSIPSSGSPPAFTLQPQPVTVLGGSLASFSIQYTGSFPVSLYWERRASGSTSWVYVAPGSPFLWSTTGVELVIVATEAMTGDQFRCVASNSLGVTASAPATLTVTDRFNAWIEGNFNPTEQIDAAFAGPAADPDGDGYSNLLEYALGQDPRRANPATQLAATLEGGQWTFTYQRPASRSDVTYTVEASSDLASWSTANVTHQLLSSTSGNESWRATVPVGVERSCFFRLKVSR